MNILRFVILSIFIIFNFSVSSFAQTENTSSNPADSVDFIDSRLFYDENNGIKELIAVSEQVDSEFRAQFKEINDLTEKWINLGEELKKLQTESEEYEIGKNSLYDEKLKEYENLGSEWEKKVNEIDKPYKNRKREAEYSVKSKIRLAVRQFAQEKNYIAIVDINEVEEPHNFTTIFVGALDVSREFIDYYNSLQSEQH